MLENYNNYGPFVDYVKTGNYTLITSDITNATWNSYFNGILNIMKDGIETEFVQTKFIEIDFGNNTKVHLSVFDVFFNLLLWQLFTNTNKSIEPKHLFFPKNITRKAIKKYIDKLFIEPNKKIISNIKMNNIIDDTLCKFAEIDNFSLYLANTINLEDDIKLIKASPEYRALLTADFSKIPLEDVKQHGMELTYKATDFIMNKAKAILGYDHCLANSFRAEEGVNIRQYREYAINIGTKPDGQGGVYSEPINNSFIMGGVNSLLYYLIESSTGRIAQILSKNNVGQSGHFARLLGLNNTDTFLHDDPNYVCDTKNFQPVYIKSESVLERYIDRYYKLAINGVDNIITANDKHLIGTTVLMRSPMTCASKARGQGVCYKCYGDLAYIINDINIGKYASELLAAELTQRLLSAKHLLEATIKKLLWSEGFNNCFVTDGNCIRLSDDDDINYNNMYILIDSESLIGIGGLEDDEDGAFNEQQSSTTECINEFELMIGEQVYKINYYLEDESILDNNLYLSNEFSNVIREKKYAIMENDKIKVSLAAIVKDMDIPLFYFILQNNDLSKPMEKIMAILDNSKTTSTFTKDNIMEHLLDTIIDGGLSPMAIHCEIILSNQLRHVDDVLEMPMWEYQNEPYRLLTLNQALTDNPSITVSLLYQRLSRQLYNPLSFKKTKPSVMDVFFIEQPQKYLNSKDIIQRDKPKEEIKMIRPMVYHKSKKVEIEDEDEEVLLEDMKVQQKEDDDEE